MTFTIEGANCFCAGSGMLVIQPLIQRTPGARYRRPTASAGRVVVKDPPRSCCSDERLSVPVRVGLFVAASSMRRLMRQRRVRRSLQTDDVAAAQRAEAYDDVFIPAGCDHSSGEEDESPLRRGPVIDDVLEQEFWCPQRLAGRDLALVQEVNMWHYAMMNDEGRNQFFWDSMEKVVKGKRVLDIGAGSGLLSIMAAKLGAAEVIALEANSDLADVAHANAVQNDVDDVVKVVHGLSSYMDCSEDEKADVVISETMGRLLNGESILDYMADARSRLAVPNAPVIPAGGAQHCVLVMSPTIERLTSVCGPSHQSFRGIDISAMRNLQNTAMNTSPNAWGIRLGMLQDLVPMSRRVQLFELDFANSWRQDIQEDQFFEVEALETGTVHAVVATWEAWGDPNRSVKISTHLDDAQEQPWASVREAHWSPVIQVVEDMDAAEGDWDSLAQPLQVTKGEMLQIHVRHSRTRNNLQFTVHRLQA